MPFTTNYHPAEIVLVRFPYTSGSQSKLRPGLVLVDTGDADIVLARVTSQAYHSPYDVELHDWKQAGLLVPSWVRLHKVATLEKNLVAKSLGRLSTVDRTEVSDRLNKHFANW